MRIFILRIPAQLNTASGITIWYLSEEFVPDCREERETGLNHGDENRRKKSIIP
jgi:hypothetical protein